MIAGAHCRSAITRTNVAIWAQLTGGIRVVEREQAARGSNTPHFNMMLANLGRLLPVAVKWAIGHSQPPSAELTRRWTGELSAFVEQALAVARRCTPISRCASRDSTKATMRRRCFRPR